MLQLLDQQDGQRHHTGKLELHLDLRLALLHPEDVSQQIKPIVVQSVKSLFVLVLLWQTVECDTTFLKADDKEFDYLYVCLLLHD
jgi:hypothetical protein